MKLWTLIAVLGVALVAGTASANLLLNGDMNQPGAGSYGQITTVDLNNWTDWGTDGWYQDDIGTGPCIKFWGIGAGMYQDWSASAGVSYDLSVMAYQTVAEQLTTEEAYLKVEWFDASWGALGSTVLDTLISSDPVGSWVALSGTAVAPASTANGRIVLGLQGTDGAGAAFFDNASVLESAIPEPTVIGLSGLGIVLLSHLRRRKKA